MNYDIIIVGGAMAGATLAIALSAKTDGNLKIAVIEKQPVQQHTQSGFDARCIALADGSCQKLNAIVLPNKQTLWQQIRAVATPIRQIHVSDKGHSGIVEFSAEEFQLTQLGAVVGLEQVGKILLQAVQQFPNIDYLCPAEIARIERDPKQVKISLKNDRTLTAQLLVGADGSHSQVADAVGISQHIVREYPQTAIITNVQVQQAHQQRAFERFTNEGPLALLPMRDNLISLVWCVSNAEELMTLDDNSFLLRLQQRFGWRLGKFQQCGRRFAYPLKLSYAEQHIQPRIALIGNAAQTLHPIAGQGFNLGIRDVAALTDVLSKAYRQQKDLGDYLTLQTYETARLQDQQDTIALTDGLLSIFANNLLPLQISRNLGLMGLALCSSLRQQFAKPTLGWI